MDSRVSRQDRPAHGWEQAGSRPGAMHRGRRLVDEGVLTAHAAALAVALAGERGAGAEPSVTWLARGIMNYKLVVGLGEARRVVVRYYPSGREKVVAYEPDLLRRLAGAGLPVPAVLTDSRGDADAPLAYVVYEMIEGVPLGDRLHLLAPAQLGRVAAEVADALARMQQVMLAGYGGPIDAHHAGHDSWRAFLESSFVNGIDTARAHGTLAPAMLADLDRLAGRLGEFDALACSGVAWGEVSTANVLVDAAHRVVGLLDFEGALAAHPLLNLGYCYAARPDGAWFESLAAAWSSGLDDEGLRAMRLFAVLRAVRMARFAHLPLPTGRAQTPVEKLFPGARLALRALVRG